MIAQLLQSVAAAPGRDRATGGANLPTDRWRPMELVFWATAVACFWLFPGYLVLGSQVLIVGMFAMSLDLILGYAGIVSLGHAAFFGVGAYTAGLLSVHGWSEPFSGLLLAGAVAGLFGLIVAPLVVRGADLTRLMVTLGVGMLAFEACNKATHITGGVDGLSGVSIDPLFGVFSFDLYGQTAYLYVLAVLFLMVAFCKRLVASPFGLALRGVREGARRMPSLGAPVQRHLIAVFTIAAAVAGVAGALLAQTSQFVGLDSLSFGRSAELLIMLVLGGTGRLYGALIGAAVFMIAQDILAGINPVYWQFWLGLMLMAIVMFARGGLLGGAETLLQRFKIGGKP